MSKFKIGDKVMLSEDSYWYEEGAFDDSWNPINTEGVVARMSSSPEKIRVVWSNGQWNTYTEEDLILVEDAPKSSGKVKSNGGSSSYYDLPISDDLLQVLNSRKEDGQCFVKTEELIDELFDGLFNQGTLFKSFVRAHLQTRGEGKAGNDLNYEINKVIYYANKIKDKGVS